MTQQERDELAALRAVALAAKEGDATNLAATLAEWEKTRPSPVPPHAGCFYRATGAPALVDDDRTVYTRGGDWVMVGTVAWAAEDGPDGHPRAIPVPTLQERTETHRALREAHEALESRPRVGTLGKRAVALADLWRARAAELRSALGAGPTEAVAANAWATCAVELERLLEQL